MRIWPFTAVNHPRSTIWRRALSLKRFAPFALLLSVAPLSAMTGSHPITIKAALEPSPSLPQSDEISVLTYNVKGLPWPIANDREAAFGTIEQRLIGLRARSAQPHIMVLQEAFTDRAKQIGSNSGYAYYANGPGRDETAQVSQARGSKAFLLGSSSLKGETAGKWVDSGLQIFSDYPIVSVKRAAFPNDACAGYDCLANKGVLLVELRVPGQPIPVTIVTTHLNSRHASGVSETRSLSAYKRQVSALGDFVRSNRKADSPLIVGGDFNASSPARRAVLSQANMVLAADGTAQPSSSGLDAIRASSTLRGNLAIDAAYIARRGRDWQFFGSGPSWSIEPTALKIPFGREKDGSSLSDHFGFVIDYKIGRVRTGV